MKSIAKYLLLFLVTITLMTTALIGVATIPHDWIQTNSKESAEQLLRRNTNYYNLIGGTSGRTLLRPWDCSKIDQIADLYLLSIAYYLDEEDPLESVFWARYYDGREDSVAPLKNMNESYYRSVTENTPTNKQYLRYWHGSLVIVRPLLTILNLNQMKILAGVVLTVLLVTLLFQLTKRGFKSEALCMGIAMVSISVWFVPLSLEYIWMFILMLSASILILKKSTEENKAESLYKFFFIIGMLASYFDFFTTETITLLVPLLLCIRILCQKNNLSNTRIWLFAIKCVFLWGIGYVGCWTAKWALSSIIFRVNALTYVQERFWLHLGVNEEHSLGLGLMGAVLRNLSQLFPFGYGKIAAPATFGLIVIFVFLPVFKGWLVIRDNINWNRICLFGLLGMIVYVRFLILWQHSWRHYFFTYRAQCAPVLALCFIIIELIQPTLRKGKVIAND